MVIGDCDVFSAVGVVVVAVVVVVVVVVIFGQYWRVALGVSVWPFSAASINAVLPS